MGKEGLLLAVKHNIFKSILDVTHTQLNTILTVRMSTGTCNIRAILGYAPQETDSETNREQFYNELELEVKMCIDAGDIPLLMGDFNAKIEPSDSPQGSPISKNDILLHDLLKEHDLEILNFDEQLCTGK